MVDHDSAAAEEKKPLRIIRTGRDRRAINAAAKEGYIPLVKPVIPSPEIRCKFAVIQNRITHAIREINDYREPGPGDDEEWVVPFGFYYPYAHLLFSPFAAYLLPPDIQVGERVILEDVIDDVVGKRWNQGDTYRIERCEAIWNGTDFDLRYDPNEHVSHAVG